MNITIYTIGHSNLPYDKFTDFLRKFSVNLLVDVRSQPFSKYTPYFNKDSLINNLPKENIEYLFRGDKLGGRPKDSSLYEGGKASYSLISQDPHFQEAIQDLIFIASKNRVAIMCSEKNPINCHRFLLIGKSLKEKNVQVIHILSDGSTVTQEELEEKLKESNDSQYCLFGKQQLESSYERQSAKVAYNLVTNKGK